MSTLAFAARPGLQHLCAGVLVALIVALGSPAARAEAPTTSAEFFEKYNPGQQAYQKRDYATALKSAKEARAVAKSSFEKQAALKLMMGSAVALHNYQEAIEAIEALETTDGVSAAEKLGYYKTLAQLQGAVNHFDKAIFDYNEYLKSGNGTPADYAALAQYYFAAKDCPKSLQALDKALAATTRDAEASTAVEPVVLLSPACASFDQYRNFEVRGDAFRALVRALPGLVAKS